MLRHPYKIVLAVLAAGLNIVANGRTLKELAYSLALALVLIIAVTNRHDGRPV
jgi:hypothetical protein